MILEGLELCGVDLTRFLGHVMHNCRIFEWLRFYVKWILEIVKVQNVAFQHILKAEIDQMN